MSPSTLESNAADEAFLDEVLNEQKAEEEITVTSAVDVIDKKLAAWTLHIYNQVNGESVVRPANITKDDSWIVKYKLEQVFDEERNRTLYTQTRNRRAAALVWDLESKRGSLFTDRLRMISEAGKVWREQQDQLDAQRQKVVLYNLGEKT